jgi:hypothetical protein
VQFELNPIRLEDLASDGTPKNENGPRNSALDYTVQNRSEYRTEEISRSYQNPRANFGLQN